MFARLPLIIGLGLLLAAAMPLFDSGLFLFDLVSHFPPLGGAAAGAVFVLSLWGWRNATVRWGLGLLLCAALANAAWLLPYWPRSDATAVSETRDLRVAQLNVLLINVDYEGLAAWLRRVKPDVLVLSEVDAKWIKEMSALSDLFPYSIGRARSDVYGIALFSRFPITHGEVVSLPVVPIPALQVRLDVSGRVVRVFAAHLVPPKTQTLLTARNLSLHEMASWAAAEPDTPTLVVGDLNCTPYAAPFRTLLEEGDLEDGRIGRGIYKTWPSGFPWLFRIPIDHILHNKALNSVSLTVGPYVGSDHLPLLGDYKFAN